MLWFPCVKCTGHCRSGDPEKDPCLQVPSRDPYFQERVALMRGSRSSKLSAVSVVLNLRNYGHLFWTSIIIACADGCDCQLHALLFDTGTLGSSNQRLDKTISRCSTCGLMLTLWKRVGCLPQPFILWAGGTRGPSLQDHQQVLWAPRLV